MRAVVGVGRTQAGAAGRLAPACASATNNGNREPARRDEEQHEGVRKCVFVCRRRGCRRLPRLHKEGASGSGRTSGPGRSRRWQE